jgi:hypothetical protein
VDQSRYLTVSIDVILAEMAARGLIPPMTGLSPLEAADHVHAEASTSPSAPGCSRWPMAGT